MIFSYIKQKLKSLFYSSSTPIITPSITDIKSIIKNNYICELSFKLTKNEEVDIEFTHIDINDLTPEKILSIAEKCANLIVLVNNGLLKKQFLSTIKKYQKNNTNNSQTTLFIDNILFFNNLLQQELKIIKKENEPIIRPSNVFKSF
jgi:hypothetical protein